MVNLNVPLGVRTDVRVSSNRESGIANIEGGSGRKKVESGIANIEVGSRKQKVESVSRNQEVETLFLFRLLISTFDFLTSDSYFDIRYSIF